MMAGVDFYNGILAYDALLRCVFTLLPGLSQPEDRDNLLSILAAKAPFDILVHHLQSSSTFERVKL